MIKFTSLSFRRLALKLVLLALLVLPELAQAQFFQYDQYGGLLAGFRKTGTADTTGYEMMSDLGDVTNFLALPAGTTITITNFTAAQLTYAFANYNNLQWSVFGTFYPTRGGSWGTQFGNFASDSMWLTLPATNVNDQTTPPSRQANTSQANQVGLMLTVGSDAVLISSYSSESEYNTNTVVVESESLYGQYDLSASIADENNPADGDFGGNNTPLPYDVENTTPANFTTSQRDDFYQLVPSGATDPITGLSGTTPYFVGYFILNANGTMTFNRAFGLTASVTSGSTPLPVVFSTTATNSTANITNWVWNFGNGTIITNTTDASVTNIFTTAGTYNVTLTVYSAGGSGSVSTSIVVISGAQPLLSIAAAAGRFVINGTNAPASQQYRILTSTNLTSALTNWTPIYTNTVSSTGTFSFTNGVGGTNSFFIMISP
jgi:PKD repeat protein